MGLLGVKGINVQGKNDRIDENMYIAINYWFINIWFINIIITIKDLEIRK